MADPQFEEFRLIFDQLPQHIKAPSHCYRIAHDIDLLMSEDTPQEDEKEKFTLENNADSKQNSMINGNSQNGERRRRRLPVIPVDKKPLSRLCQQPKTLSQEIQEQEQENNPGLLLHQISHNLYLQVDTSGGQTKTSLRYYHKNGQSEDSSPDELHLLASRLSLDVDSGNSSAHSPDGVKSTSPVNGCLSKSSSSTSTFSLTPSGSKLHLHDATHRGLYKFIPRHTDEVEIDIGDPVYVQKEAEDFWCEGINLRTSKSGIFPSAYVTDIDYNDFGSENSRSKKERYLVDFLGSIEVTSHKGNDVLCHAVQKVAKARMSEMGIVVPYQCILEISDQGLRMVDRSRSAPIPVPIHDYFFNLKNVTFCGYHPFDHRYFGFITKHPLHQRFACHVFKGGGSTRDIAEAVGRAFQRFYQKFIETIYPTEDIYIE
ncbi:JNK-interacting protein 1-like isoform X1 [Centruroides sculpturatus]|uniref:JNK-interacting protein 1-like isoform X1 n=2 Tax=Centruroides sculpturatus TaxID=218467 RepID=UPI000C6CA6DE|nr:JNK-interacting protein 1-like isoform X1 [Centruroides sculpturatus]XP_023238978.1 JNK-interacting protein 1-like isoform X1 [Centruroides sculpturatus]